MVYEECGVVHMSNLVNVLPRAEQFLKERYQITWERNAIGRGSYSCVFKGLINGNTDCAIKISLDPMGQDSSRIENEWEQLKNFSATLNGHPNLLSLWFFD